eukprot:TRINITY_DN45433_c0_g1_i1.p1 TRINITY_DN45433_c0_g1~~TRINITY_DN45433_c0_g1_i1.p1  ORF type:complete len:299 (+),score=50.75 TRINITY_DN45433_c0_g1_i1:105-1001(+)
MPALIGRDVAAGAFGELPSEASSSLSLESNSCLCAALHGSMASAPTRRPPLLGKPLCEALQWYVPPRRPYSRRELLADRVVNFSGVALALLGTPALAYISWAAGDVPSKQLGFLAHCMGLLVMLTCSALYHLWCWDWKNASRYLSMDHIGISAMIVGTYTPPMQYVEAPRVLLLVWVLGISGCFMELHRLRTPAAPSLPTASASGGEDAPKATAWTTLDLLHVARYLIMGWSCLLVAPSMGNMPPAALYPICIGGVLYTGGVVVFMSGWLEFHLPIWHGIVILASSLFYFSNLIGLAG